MGAILDCLVANKIQTQENSMTSDAAIIWSVLWNGRMAANKQVYEHYRMQNKPVIVVDIGALYRGQTWKVAVNHINATGYYGHTENVDLDRPKKLGISLAYNFSNNPAILIAGQHNKSLQLQNMPDQEAWISEMIQKIKDVTDKEVHVRPHPRCKLNVAKLPLGVQVLEPKQLANTYDSFNIHFNYHAVVNYNSGPGIQAAIAGTRPIVDSSSLAAPVSIQLEDIDKPYTIDRHQWLAEICHTEYTLDELRRGLWLKRIQPALTT